jgi:hypothetical protein
VIALHVGMGDAPKANVTEVRVSRGPERVKGIRALVVPWVRLCAACVAPWAYDRAGQERGQLFGQRCAQPEDAWRDGGRSHDPLTYRASPSTTRPTAVALLVVLAATSFPLAMILTLTA